jgi:methionyl-tRNA synthetase
MQEKPSKNFYITTSIPYVNGDPHIGFAMELVQADVLARYARQRGETVMFSAGADEHGTKVAEKAKELGKSPQEYTDEMSQKFRDLAGQLHITNDRFIRTTDLGHMQRAQLIWTNLKDDIYKAKYSGWYDVRQEEFVPENQVDPARTKPDHPQAYQKLEEENYFFRLSKYNDQIKAAIESDELRIIPKTKRNEILGLIKEGLEDISISRPKEKLDWGVPVPGDDTQVMYVWFEALMNYITVLGYPEHVDFKKYWPADIQVVGKDISRFHAAIWPGMLLSLGLPMQKNLFVHSFITVNGEKMSKSIGNVIPPSEIIAKYGVDAFRYYFLRHIPSYEDGDFSWTRFEEVYNSELANELGNLVSRTAAMITKYQNGLIGAIPEPEHDVAAYVKALEDCKFDRALEQVWRQVKGMNQYIDEEKPWVIARDDDPAHLREVLAYVASSILQITELIAPFMPETATKITKIFNSGVIQPIDGTLFPKQEQKHEAS